MSQATLSLTADGASQLEREVGRGVAAHTQGRCNGGGDQDRSRARLQCVCVECAHRCAHDNRTESRSARARGERDRSSPFPAVCEVPLRPASAALSASTTPRHGAAAAAATALSPRNEIHAAKRNMPRTATTLRNATTTMTGELADLKLPPVAALAPADANALAARAGLACARGGGGDADADARALLSATVCVGLYPHIAARRAGETSFRTERGLKVQTFDELTSTHGFHALLSLSSFSLRSLPRASADRARPQGERSFAGAHTDSIRFLIFVFFSTSFSS